MEEKNVSTIESNDNNNEVKLELVPANLEAVPAPASYMLEAEPVSTDKVIKSKVYTADDFLNGSFGELVPIVENLIYEKTVNSLAGEPKKGKSTFARDLIRSVADGTDFLGLKTTSCNVLYIPLDEPNSLVKRGLTKVNITNTSKVFISKLENSDNVFEDIVQLCKTYECKLVVVDLLDSLATLQDNNHYSEVNKLMRIFRSITDAYNIAFLLLRHASKANPKASIGSQSFDGSMDNLLSVYSSRGRYFYETKGRIFNIDKTEITLDQTTHRLSVNAEDNLPIEDKVLNAIEENEGISATEIAKQVKKRKDDVLKATKTLEDEKKVKRLGPKLYLVASENEV